MFDYKNIRWAKDAESKKNNNITNIVEKYEKTSRFDKIRNNRFFISVPLIVINIGLLVAAYFINGDDHEAFLRSTIFIHLPIMLVIMGWLLQGILVMQRELNSFYYKRFENLFTKMIDGCALHEIICDENNNPIDYRFLNVNPAFETLTGLKAKDIIGKTIREVMPGTEYYWIDIYGRVALTGEGAHFENYSQSVDRYYEVTAFATDYKQFAVVFIDITDKRILDQRKTELEVEKSKNALLSSVLSNLSHDFRTPISIINTSLYLIERLEDPVKRQDKINQIKMQAELFERFIKDVISILNLEYATTTNKTHINVNDILRDVCYSFNHRIQRRGLRLNLNNDFDIPDIIANPNQMAQVFSAIIENAINFTEDGGLISVSTFKKNDDIKIVVEDTGIGISKDDLSLVYEKFYRVDKARSAKSGGLGLGLSIVKKIIELHQFNIDISSVLNKGTKVEITVPSVSVSKTKTRKPATTQLIQAVVVPDAEQTKDNMLAIK